MGRVSVLRTLFLHPPSFQGFDGGAGSRYQARREIRSFWYPTWLAQPAALVPGSRLVDAPPADLTLADVLPLAREYELAVLHTSAPSFGHDVKVAEALKGENPALRIGLIGAHVAVQREAALAASPALDFVCGNEFDFTIREIAEGWPPVSVAGLSYRDIGGELRRTPERPVLEDMDSLPWVVDVYARDLDVEHYAIGYLQHPYLSLYTGRGCRSKCTFCLWPQTVGGHRYRTRSVDNVVAEIAHARRLFPQGKEYFFDDDTFTDDMPRAEASALGIKIHGTFILGLPGETSETIETTIRFAQEIDPHTLQVSLAAPYPGTALYEQALEGGWLESDGLVDGRGAQASVLGYPHLSRTEIFQALETFYRRFYFRPRKLVALGAEMLRDRTVMKRRLGEGLEFVRFLARRRQETASSSPTVAKP